MTFEQYQAKLDDLVAESEVEYIRYCYDCDAINDTDKPCVFCYSLVTVLKADNE